MQWSVRTFESKLKEESKKNGNWHAWWAWHPVRIQETDDKTDWVWLEQVYRKGKFYNDRWNWKYRRDEFDLIKDKSFAS